MLYPGTLFQLKASRISEASRYGPMAQLVTISTKKGSTRYRAKLALIISVRETGYGTKGPKWDALVMSGGTLVEITGAWKIEDWFHVYKDSK